LPVALARPETAQTSQVFYSNATVIVAVHVLALTALIPYAFSWTGVALVFLGNYVFGSIGVNIGYHRLLTHRGFRCPKWFEYTTAVLGLCSLQDSPARWVAIHRLHHKHSDEQPDPHSPLVSFCWSHFGWIFIKNRTLRKRHTLQKFTPDLLQHPFYAWLDRPMNWLKIYLAHVVLLVAGGCLAGWAWTGSESGALQFGVSVFVWGVVVRTVYVWHITWAVNSVTHLWGYRNYETGDNSRNNWIVALLTNGEGWHNNHHACQRSARHGHRWYELDLTYATLLALRAVGLVSDLVQPSVPSCRRVFAGVAAGSDDDEGPAVPLGV
jgi:stearoyl-CoA desaturase (delta-9 desaturase)